MKKYDNLNRMVRTGQMSNELKNQVLSLTYKIIELEHSSNGRSEESIKILLELCEARMDKLHDSLFV